MEILKFIIHNFDNIIVIFVVISTCIMAIKKGEVNVLKEILFAIITEAENEYGAKTGELKFSVVANELYEIIPALIRPLFTAKDIENLIENALADCREKWAENDNLLTDTGTNEE